MIINGKEFEIEQPTTQIIYSPQIQQVKATWWGGFGRRSIYPSLEAARLAHVEDAAIPRSSAFSELFRTAKRRIVKITVTTEIVEEWDVE